LLLACFNNVYIIYLAYIYIYIGDFS